MTTFLMIIAIFLYFFLKNKNNANKSYIIGMSVILIVVSGLRHEAVGNDTLAYMQLYEGVGSESWSSITDNFLDNYLNPLDKSGKDPGYRVLTKVLYTFLPDARLYLFVVAVIFIGAFGYFLSKNSKSLETTLFSYMFYLALFWGYLPNSAVRQSLTIGAIMVGYTFLQQKKLAQFILLVLLGSLIHKSGLLVLILIPLYYFINANKFYKYSIALFALSLLFSDQFAMLFMDQNEVYNNYLGGYYGGENGSKPFMVIILFFGLYIFGWMGLPEDANEEGNRLNYIGISLALVFLPLIWVNPSLIRIVGYFAPFMGIAVGDSFGRINNGSLFRILVIVVFIYHSLSYFDSFKMMWQHMELHERYGQVIELPTDFVINNFCNTAKFETA